MKSRVRVAASAWSATQTCPCPSPCPSGRTFAVALLSRRCPSTGVGTGSFDCAQGRRWPPRGAPGTRSTSGGGARVVLSACCGAVRPLADRTGRRRLDAWSGVESAEFGIHRKASMKCFLSLAAWVVAVLVVPALLVAQPPLPPAGGPPPGLPPGFDLVTAERPLVAQFDRDGDRRLNLTERTAAREWLATQPPAGLAGVLAQFGPPGRTGSHDQGARLRAGLAGPASVAGGTRSRVLGGCVNREAVHPAYVPTSSAGSDPLALHEHV